MILYLSRNESANLLDRAASENSLHIRKMSGNFCLSEFIVRDMRKFASCRYFCVERLAVTEKNSEFIEALQSFRMMHSARIIVIRESASETDSFTRELVRIGVTDIVTAPDTDGKLNQIAECLSDEGMRKYRPKEVMVREYDDETDEEKETLAQSIVLREMEDEQYRFDCVNVRIGVIGATRRVGTTTAALGLTNFIKNHGGTACYAALNVNRHLETIALAYGFDAEEDYYTYDAIDFYESMMPKYDYNFVILDFGDLYHGDIRREAVKGFKECEGHLLCGASHKRFEVMELGEALKAVKSVKPLILTYAPNSEVGELFRSTVIKEPIIIKPVRNILDFKSNGIMFKRIIQPYIVETSKRL
jgi:hypothetical protein